MTKTVREVIDLLKENGWEQLSSKHRGKGGHKIFAKKGARRPIVVPGNLNDELRDGTLISILREAGLK